MKLSRNVHQSKDVYYPKFVSLVLHRSFAHLLMWEWKAPCDGLALYPG